MFDLTYSIQLYLWNIGYYSGVEASSWLICTAGTYSSSSMATQCTTWADGNISTAGALVR